MMIELLKRSLNPILLLLFISCSVSAPIIREYDWEIMVVEDLEKDIVYEQLSVFVNCYDEDGENDIETIFFIDDDNGIYWELNEENWDYKIIDDVKWLGSASIIMPDRSNIPRVPLRLHVRDLSGESVEDKIYITKNKKDLESLIFPELKIVDGKYSLINYDNALIQILLEDEILSEGEILSEPKSFYEIFNKEREEYNNDIEYLIIINEKDLNIKSGPWFDL